nr:tRNA (adenosine(37)-N6)-threonylcarbamoyltransferase complex transferase subunit TsaD [Chthoniobacterales bacterium]
YPGGPEIERRARAGDGTRFDLPRSMLDSRDHNFSFSGLKTAVRYLIAKLLSESGTCGRLDEQTRDDICASFQRAAVEVLVRKTLRAARECHAQVVTLSGGVSCNRSLGEAMENACAAAGLQLLVPPPSLCTDNAAMIAFAAALRFESGYHSAVTEEIDPNLTLASSL